MANILRCAFDSVHEWPIREVTVYEDRAQVVRILEYKSTDAGEAELKLTNLPMTLVPQSVRAEVLSGNANVAEVTSQIETKYKEELENSVREFEIQERLKKLKKQTGVLQQRKEFFQSLFDKLVPPQELITKQGLDNSIFDSFSSVENLQAFSESLNGCSDEIKKIVSREHEIEREVSLLGKEHSKIVQDRQVHMAQSSISKREVSVLLNVPEEDTLPGIIEVKLTYVVYSCNWSALYDMRVDKVSNSVDLAYYGEVKNNSGEDWKDVQIFLSTAKPSRGGELPFLPRANVRYIPKQPRANKQKLDKKIKEFVSLAEEENMSVSEFTQTSELIFVDEENEKELININQLDDHINRSIAVAEERGGSATFKLNRLCTIESDNISRKQKIADVSLVPRFSYVVSPQVASTAYLRCSTRNDSSFVFVRGKMNVFFNGSFVTQSELKFVNKKEDFKVFLGKEESIKVRIFPQLSKKEISKGGLITSKVNKETFTRKIIIENTRDESIDVVLYEQLPLARDKKIRVEVLSPVLGKNKKNESYKINNMNNLEVRRLLKKLRVWEFKFSYRVEWPKNTDLVYTQSLENLAR